jgi:hypothetical protein
MIVLTHMKLVLLTTTLIAVAVFGCSGGDPEPGATATPTASATTLPAERAAAIAEVQDRFPALLPAITAIESENADAILDALRWEEFECTPEDHRGGIAPRCSELGVPAGTLVPMFRYELLTTSYFTEDQMRERIDAYLVGRNPELGLIASHPDGRWLVTFTVDDTGNEGLRGVDFLAEASGQAPFVSHTERFAASTPLDTIREEERDGQARWEILYTSPALHEWDAE